ncbi:copper homeostasis protein CutC [Actinotalea subterranea]|uniref:copper homeostasis protein CutC n=1 Tax=Actinotalea subterranea TaxID=2607497 RepID=UPI0011EC67D0|nr:copper homeostasis protein CutC [Actinotalea subterranea]
MEQRTGRRDGGRTVAVEVCLEDVGGAQVAEAAGADRVELCAALSEGGLTPSLGFVEAVLDDVRRVAVQVLVRPRGGDFVVDDADLAVMVADVHAFARLPRAVELGFTVGTLTPDGRVDERALGRLVGAADGLPVTFHKAFDAVPDRSASLEALVRHGVGRVLTSGGAPDALAGADALAALVEQADGRVAVMAGGSVRPANVARVVELTGVRDVHLRAPREVPSRSTTGPSAYDDGRRTVTSGELVRDVVAALRA